MKRAYNELPSPVATLYDELLDRLLAREAGVDVTAPKGTIVRKAVRGREYLYLQVSALGRRKQLYLGPDSAALRETIDRVEGRWAEDEEHAETTAALVAMLRRGRALGPTGAAARLLAVLAEHQVFRARGVLIGSHAFIAYGAMLGVRWASGFRTDDLDVAAEPRIALAVDAQASIPEAVRTLTPPLTGIPGFDPREPSTSFSSRGTELRLDIVTPLVGKPSEAKVELPSLGVHAQPLRFLDYLLAETIPAAVLHGAGLLAHVPSPARFALHKLLVASERRPHEANRARKDRAQCSALLQLLGTERPGDLELAWTDLATRGRGWLKRIDAQADLLEPEPRATVASLR